jgi:uncharacterized membrane protein
MSDDAPNTACLNCAAPLTGPFCAACGQRDLGTRVDLSELVGEFVSETFELEGRLPRTVGSLAFLPGHYLDAYLAGRRRSFSSPIRVYLASLFLVVLVIAFRAEQAIPAGFAAGHIATDVHGGNVGFHAGSSPKRADHRDPWGLLDDLPDQGRAGLRTLEGRLHETCLERPDTWTERLGYAMELLAQRHADADLARVFALLALEQVPTALVALVGVLVGLLKLLGWRQPMTVHVITSITFHALAMLGLTAWLLVPSWWMAWLVNGWLQAHLIVGLKVAYDAGWPRTWARYAVLSVCWAFAGLLAVGGTFVLALLAVAAEG